MSAPLETDVVVVGAGLAGLRCANELTANGLDVRVLEAGDGVGGRVRTDEIDGFLCDRGFQLLNPAYPAVRRDVDVARLGLQSFTAGVAVRREGGLKVLADPRRAPTRLPASLTSGLLRPRELAGLARWIAPALVRPQRLADDPSADQSDTTLSESLDAARVDGPLRREVLEPFLAGVLADDSGETSAAFVKLLVRSFLLGTPGLPRGGMQALPKQIAEPLDGRIDLSSPVVEIVEESSTVRVVTAQADYRARAVVVAVGAQDFEKLTGAGAPRTCALTTWWFAADEAPYDQDLLTLDGRGRSAGERPTGPVQHAAVVSNAAASYAPAGRHLVQATCLAGRADADHDEPAVRRQLAELWSRSTDGWQVLTRHVIEHALPAMPPPLRATAPTRLRGRLYAAGDHRDTASIQGALASGERVARAVVADVGGSR